MTVHSTSGPIRTDAIDASRDEPRELVMGTAGAGRGLRRAATAIAAGCLALGLFGAPPAHADPRQDAVDALELAASRTEAAAANGIDVEQFVTYRAPFSLTHEVVGVNTVLRSGSRLRIHVTTGSDGSGYASVRRMPTGRLVAAGGVDPATGEVWATVSMLDSQYLEQARSAGLSSVTALTNLPSMGGLSLVYSPGMESWLYLPRKLASSALVPPNSRYGEAFYWTTIEMIRQADGGMLFRGSQPAINDSGAEEEELDMCVRPLVEIRVGPDMLVRSSRWREVCPQGGNWPAGTRTYQATATYGPVTVKGPVSPSRRACSVLRYELDLC